MTSASSNLTSILATLPQLTADELNKVSEAIEAARVENATTRRAELLAEVQQKAAALGVSLEDLIRGPQTTKARKPRATPNAAKSKVAPKYRGPDGAEWTGRGRPPRWVAVLEAEGKRREDYLIDKN